MFFKRIFYFCLLVAFCAFAWLRLCTFVLLLGYVFVLVRVKSFCKKNKEFKIALITSSTLLIISIPLFAPVLLSYYALYVL